MAEWWVDPENGATTNAGTLAAPWQLVPGQAGADAQTGYAVANGDIINVRNGTTVYLSSALAPPKWNLTYRGYGLADNVLEIPLPDGSSSAPKVRRVAREWGAHEGMWTLDCIGGLGGSSAAISVNNAAPGLTVEDVCVRNVHDAGKRGCILNASNQTAIGATIRRSAFLDTEQAFSIYRPDTLLEDVLIDGCQEEGISTGTTVSQGYHAGRYFRARRVALLNCGLRPAADGGLGDAIQMVASSPGWAGEFTVEDFYVRKPSSVKQGIALTGVNGPFTFCRFLLDATDGGSGSGIMIAEMYASAAVRIQRGVVRETSAAQQPFVRRLDTPWSDGATLLIEHVDHQSEQSPGFFIGYDGTTNVGAAITIRNNTIRGKHVATYSYMAVIALVNPSGAGTLTAAARLTVENNVIVGANDVGIRLPEGGGNDARWVVRGNIIVGATDYAIIGRTGGVQCATAAALESAHSYATGNSDADPQITSDGRPLPGSPLIDGGADLGTRRDFNGVQGRKYIGAFTPPTLRAR